MPYTNRCNLSISGNDINATVNSIEYDYVGFYYSLPDNRHPKTVNGHTYFISGLFSCPKQATVSFGVGSSSIKQLVPANTLYSYNTIQKQTSDAVGAMFTCWIEDIQVGDTFKVQNWNVIDLTQMFGTGNEPTTVEEFRALYPDSYYPYNAGELRNLDCNGIKTVGFNQWDEQWEVGYLKADGTTAGYVQNYIRAKNYIPVISGEKYYVKLPNGVSDVQLFAVDENYNLIKQIYSWINNRFVIPDGAAYIRFYMKYGSEVYNNDICINLSHTGYRNGEYEPYKEVTHSLPLSQITNGEPLRKAGSVYDEINETHYIKRVGVVDLGSLSWSQNPNYGFYASIGELSGMQNVTSNEIVANIFCAKYTAGRAVDIFTQAKTNSIAVSTTHLVVGDLTYNNANDFKTAMSGVMLNYELAEPIVTPIETPIDFNYYVEDFGTEEALLAEDSAPFSADIVYQFNATDTIRVLEKNIKQLLNKIISLENTITNAITNSNNL